jgi:hypothetical protein
MPNAYRKLSTDNVASHSLRMGTSYCFSPARWGLDINRLLYMSLLQIYVKLNQYFDLYYINPT